MAYRHALALACVTFGIFAAGCGDGGPGPSAQPADADQLPSAGSDQPAPNPDQPPSAAGDQPAPSSDQPPGGPTSDNGETTDAVAKCRGFCENVGSETDCPGNGANAIAREVCKDQCVVTAEIAPCLAEAVGLIDCLTGLDGLCTEDGLSEAQNAQCNGAAGQLNDCVKGDDTTGTPPGNCTLGNQCMGCADSCAQCRCAGLDASLCDLVCQ